jgi:capsular exopolysaccharide synthesis family protein
MLNYRVIATEKPKSVITEQYRKLRTNIEFSSFDKALKVINMTSSLSGEGKTMSCLNLATVYAQANQKTLLIDMDLRRPKIHRAFKLPNKDGLTDFIADGKPVHDYILTVNDTLDVLFSGESIPFPTEIFSSKKIHDMMTELKKKYDKIIIDCPPVNAVADALLISNFSDATVYVVASRHTPYTLIKTHIQELSRSGANIIGGLMTRVEKRDQYYGLDYYYYDYKAYA